MTLTYKGKQYATVQERAAAMQADVAGKTGFNSTGAPPTSSTVNAPTPAPAGASPFPRDLARENAILAKYPNYNNPKLLLEATYSADQLANMPEYRDLLKREELKQNLTNAAAPGYTPRPSNSLLRPLEDALRMKQQVGDQELGTSKLFEAAGLSGYATLAQSMAERSNEMKQRYGSFANQMEVIGTQLSDAYNQSLTSYKLLTDEYDKQVETINDTLKGIAEHERAIELMDKQHALDMEILKLKANLDNTPSRTGGDYVATGASTGGNFKNFVTGMGTITAGGAGQPYSPAWKWGLDITGTHDSAIKSPIEGEVIFAGWNKNGFGNQVKIKKADGTEIWLSHLNAINPDIVVGSKVYREDQVGTLGNTGTVIDMGGGGYHVDITMKKADGSYYDPKDVEKFVGGLGLGALPESVTGGGAGAGDITEDSIFRDRAGYKPQDIVMEGVYGKKSPLSKIIDNPAQMDTIRTEVASLGVEKTKIKIKQYLREQGDKWGIDNLESDANVEKVYNAL